MFRWIQPIDSLLRSSIDQQICQYTQPYIKDIARDPLGQPHHFDPPVYDNRGTQTGGDKDGQTQEGEPPIGPPCEVPTQPEAE